MSLLTTVKGKKFRIQLSFEMWSSIFRIKSILSPAYSSTLRYKFNFCKYFLIKIDNTFSISDHFINLIKIIKCSIKSKNRSSVSRFFFALSQHIWVFLTTSNILPAFFNAFWQLVYLYHTGLFYLILFRYLSWSRLNVNWMVIPN